VDRGSWARRSLKRKRERGRDYMQSLELGREADDGELEGVVLGLVLTASKGWEEGDGKGDYRGLLGNESDREVVECLERASESVEERRQMEGVLEFDRGGSGGSVGFLVYRVD